jgi:Cu/Zn superoxide dismutase
MPIGAWSKVVDFPAGCDKIFDLYLDGEGDAYNVATVEEKGEDLNWGMDMDNRYLGVHGIAMHRFAKCESERKLLGVACIEVEVK